MATDRTQHKKNRVKLVFQEICQGRGTGDEGVGTTTVMVGAGIGRSVALVWVLFRVMSVSGGLEKLSDGFQQITEFFWI